MSFYDYREPIENVVDKYFERKRWYAENNKKDTMSAGGGEYPDDRLPDNPCKILRNDKNRAYKFIYGNTELLETDEECDPVIWQEELLMDTNGVITKIKTTYPDGSTVESELVRDESKKVTQYKQI